MANGICLTCEKGFFCNECPQFFGLDEDLQSSEVSDGTFTLYEMAIAKFVADPSLETVNKISLPLIGKAYNGDVQIRQTYLNKLDIQIQKYLKSSLVDILSERERVFAEQRPMSERSFRIQRQSTDSGRSQSSSL